jgi:hypothetical protein
MSDEMEIARRRARRAFLMIMPFLLQNLKKSFTTKTQNTITKKRPGGNGSHPGLDF